MNTKAFQKIAVMAILLFVTLWLGGLIYAAIESLSPSTFSGWVGTAVFYLIVAWLLLELWKRLFKKYAGSAD